MARPTTKLIHALRATAARLEAGAEYRWTHMGACNCGHLARTLTHLPSAELHRLALQRAGDWGEQAVEYCAESGLPIDHVIDAMLEAGLELGDITHLEKLSDPLVLRSIPAPERRLSFRRRADVVRYLDAWADLLEGQATLTHSGVRGLPWVEDGRLEASGG